MKSLLKKSTSRKLIKDLLLIFNNFSFPKTKNVKCEKEVTNCKVIKTQRSSFEDRLRMNHVILETISLDTPTL